MAAAADAWGEDDSEPSHFDPIAAATEGWGDDGTRPVRYEPVAAAQGGWDDDGAQQVHYDSVAETQEGWGDDGSQPVREALATEDKTPADEAPVDTEQETTPVAAMVDNEEGQVTKERIRMKRCIWI